MRLPIPVPVTPISAYRKHRWSISFFPPTVLNTTFYTARAPWLNSGSLLPSRARPTRPDSLVRPVIVRSFWPMRRQHLLQTSSQHPMTVDVSLHLLSRAWPWNQFISSHFTPCLSHFLHTASHAPHVAEPIPYRIALFSSLSRHPGNSAA